jgi:iron complex outermembrane receptor protein
LTDTLRLTTGLRYTQDRKTFDSQVFLRELGNGYSGGTGSTVFPAPGYLVYDFGKSTVGDLAKQDEGLMSGKVQLDYKPNADTLLYAGISRGVKGAGFNGNLGGTLTNEETPFHSESVLTYEIGAKTDGLDNRLRLNGSVYYYDYTDYQGFAFNGTQGVVGNYEGTFYGADFEMLAQLPGDLRLNLGGAYSHTELQDVPTAYMGVRDTRAVMAPEWIFNGSLQKKMPVGTGNLSLVWSFDYLSDRYASVDNNPATYVSGSTVHNLRVAYELPGPKLEFAAFVNNVLDEERQAFVYDLVPTGGFTINVFDKPRWYGVSVRKSF